MDTRKLAEANRILEIKSGSHLYGTSTPTSDVDFVGIFMPGPEHVFGLSSIEECDLGKVSKLENGKNAPDAVDRKLYEFRNYLRLAQQNNPNILEMLFASPSSIVFVNDLGRELIANAHLFPYKGLFGRFIGYAHSQKHKMIVKGEHFDELRRAALVLPYAEPRMLVEEYFRLSCDSPDCCISRAGELDRLGRETPCDQYKIGDLQFPQGVAIKYILPKLMERLDKLTNRSELVLKYGYDVKFSMHLIRLLLEGRELLETGRLEFPLKDRDLLLAIRNGEYRVDQILELSDALETECERARDASSLPDKPRVQEIEALAIRMMKRHLQVD